MESINVKQVTRTALLIALTLAFQSMGLQQMITGPVVNMLLFLGVVLVGPWGAAITGLITPIMALWVGILKPPLAPMVPAIALGNAIMCILFGALSRTMPKTPIVGRVAGVAVGSVVKFLVLTGTVRYLVQVPPPIAAAMGSIQLVNALLGGAAALVMAEILARTGLTTSGKR